MIGNLIAAGASLLGGLLGKSSAEKQNAANLAAQNAIADKNIQLQKDFAQQGIRWKVEDARNAGIHPIYALGAPTHSFSPVSIGAQPGADMSMANAVNSMGQDIGRAVNSTRTADQREDAYTMSVKALTLQKYGLENELLGAQIAKLRAANNPPFPTPGVDPFFPPDKPSKQPILSLGAGQGQYLTDPSVANADDFEKRYGEMSDFFYGPYVWWRDFNYRTRLGPTSHERTRQRWGNPPDWLMQLTGEK